MTTTEQRTLALGRANDKRARMSALKQRLRTERGALAGVLLDPPDELAHMPVIDVVRLAWGLRASRSLERLGRLALRDGVNLMMPLGHSSARTRSWLAEHASWNWMAGQAYTRRYVVVADGEAA